MRIIVRCFLFFLLSIVGVSHTYAAMRIRFHHDMSSTSPVHYGVEKFKEKLDELSNHKIQVNIYPNNVLGDDIYSTELLQLGVIHAAVIPTSKLANFHPPLKKLDYPFIFKDKLDAYQKLDGEMGNKLIQDLNKKGMIGLGFWEAGFKQITCNNVFQRLTPDNPYPLNGISVRIMSSPILFSQYKAAKALPLVIPFSELYVALEHGIVKCQENPITTIATTKIYEVQNELLLSNHAYLGYVFIVSKSWYDTLSLEDKLQLRKAEQYARNLQRQQVSNLEESYLKEILTNKHIRVVSPDYISTLRKNFLLSTY
ncbi:TRAP transporter substrate-binding protein [Avibacterium sp. 21-599]|nr:TRAP transporter substrate-binding protein [Avibacterium sp. 21-599]MCW9718126.1 TRAP transporter substrate-binding protein [Avibacterium sp. 21-599]